MSYVDPIDVIVQLIDRKRQQFGIPFLKMWFMHSESSQFGRAYRCKIRGMREQHNPPATRTKKKSIVGPIKVRVVGATAKFNVAQPSPECTSSLYIYILTSLPASRRD